MKKLLSALSILAVVGVLVAANQLTLDNFNVDDSGNVTATSISADVSADSVSASTVTLSGQIPVVFSVAVDTTSVSPTAAGQVILGDDYNLYVSSCAGGSWYKIGGK